MLPWLYATYEFHPAGQGIFASGRVSMDNPEHGAFHWVFDCGSVADAQLRGKVRAFRDNTLKSSKLGLLCISHFDFDHVSGLPSLLSRLHVGTVVLPYYSPLERLVLGIQHAEAPEFYRLFLSNPVGWLLANAASINNIVVVHGNGDGDEPPFPQDHPFDVPPENNGGEDVERGETSWRLKLPPEDEVSDNGDSTQAFDNSTPSARLISPQTRTQARHRGTKLHTTKGPLNIPLLWTNDPLWEFLFYHKPLAPGIKAGLMHELTPLLSSPPTESSAPGTPSKPRPSKVFAKANTLSNALKALRTLVRPFQDKGTSAPADLLAALSSMPTLRQVKKAYLDCLGGSENLNAASLCLYAGPVNMKVKGIRFESKRWHDHPLECCGMYHGGSILYTGDANLSQVSDYRMVLNFLTEPRRGQVAVFQVPHHGSQNNWTPGNASQLPPVWPVFCADPHYKPKWQHPHIDVITDFNHLPLVMVNGEHGAKWGARFRP